MQDAISPAPLPKLSVFLCHSSGDKPQVHKLYQQLMQDGFDPWLDEEKLLPGQDWRVEISKAVRACDVVVVCLSKASITKEGYVQKEIKFALDIADEKPEGRIFIIPIRLEEVGVPERLSRWHWVNYFEADGYEKLARALIRVSIEISTKRGAQSSTNRPPSSPTSLSPDKPAVHGVIQWTIKIDARLEDVNELELARILDALRQISGDMHLNIDRIKAGSVKLFVSGSQEGFDRMKDLFNVGKVRKLLGYTILDVHLTKEMVPMAAALSHPSPSDSGEAPRPAPEKEPEGPRPLLPLAILREAIRAVPAVKYALGIAGIIAVIAIVQGFNLDLKIAALGSGVMLVLMTMLVLFARLTSASPRHFQTAVLVFTWFSLLLTMATAGMMFTSVIWRKPIDFTTWLVKQPAPIVDFVKQPAPIVDIDRPDPAEVFSREEHFLIMVKGTLDIKTKLPAGADPLSYQIYVFVHPIAIDGWWPQRPVTVRQDWVVETHLGGIGKQSANDNDRFEIIAVVAKNGQVEDDKYRSLPDLKKHLEKHGGFTISKTKTIIARR